MAKSTLNIKYLTPEELERLFRVIESPRDRAIFRLAYHRGLRASEVGELQMDDYAREEGTLEVRRRKNGIKHRFGLTDMETKVLRVWLRQRGGEPGAIFISNRKTAISQQMLDVLMKRYCAAASIPIDKAHFHTLRHSCATHLLGLGREITEVKRQLGHRSITSTLEYAQITDRHAKRIDRELKGWK